MKCQALPDSGNTWESVISAELFQRLGNRMFDLKKSNVGNIGTASKSESLDVIGQVPKPLNMTIEGIPGVFLFQPYVVNGLSMEVNISKGFMEKNGWDQMHSTRSLRIKNNGARPLPVPAYSTINCKIPPRSVAYLPSQMTDYQPKGRIATIIMGDDKIEAATWSAKQEPVPDVFPLVEVRNYSDKQQGIMNTQLLSEWLVEPGAVYSVALEEKFPMTKREKTRDFFREFAAQQKTDEEILEIEAPIKRLTPEKWTDQEKINWIKKEFSLGTDDALSDKAAVSKAAECLLEHFDLFSFNGEFGKTHLMEHYVRLIFSPLVKGFLKVFLLQMIG